MCYRNTHNKKPIKQSSFRESLAFILVKERTVSPQEKQMWVAELPKQRLDGLPHFMISKPKRFEGYCLCFKRAMKRNNLFLHPLFTLIGDCFGQHNTMHAFH